MKRLLVLVAVAVAILGVATTANAAVPVPPGPYETDAQCLECHSVANNGPVVNKVDFDVDPVDRQTACAKCHWIGDPATTPHPFHNAGMACSGCHPGWGSAAAFTPAVEAAPDAWFVKSSSLAADSESLHRIHLNAAWPSTKSVRAGQTIGGLRVATTSYCGSCHAAAECSDCHGDIAHGDHTFDEQTGSRMGTPVVTTVCTGTPVGDQSVNNAAARGITCLAAPCHAASVFKTTLYRPNTANVAMTGTWGYLTDTRLMSGSAIYATRAATVTVGNLSEGRFVIRGFKHPNGGVARILVDGRPVADVSCYGTFAGSTDLYSGMLGSGTHSVQVAWTGIRGSGGGTLASFEALLKLGDPAAFKPDCFGCHGDKDDTHGYDPVQHTSGWDFGRCVQSGCHATADLMPLHTEHNPEFTCNTCHRSTDTAVNWSIFQGDGSCSSCHATAHSMDLAPASSGVPRYPGFIWSTPLQTSLFAGESWLPFAFGTEGNVIMSNRRTDVDPVDIWEFYRTELLEQGWSTTAAAPDADTVSFSATYTYGPYVLTVVCYSGDTPSSQTPISAGYRLKLLYK